MRNFNRIDTLKGYFGDIANWLCWGYFLAVTCKLADGVSQPQLWKDRVIVAKQ